MSVPFALRVRSSTWFIGLTVFLGILVDIASYGLVVPVIPFRLRALGYPEENIGSLTGWLVAAYALGLVISSPPVGYLGARFKSRRNPLLAAMVFMAGASVLFILSRNFIEMLFARILQGISGTAIWSLGVSLVHDSVPAHRAGIVLGYVLIGMSVGALVGPLAGGLLYEAYGWVAPFVFALILLAFDFILRLLVIEKHTALEYIRSGAAVIPGFEAPGYEEGEVVGEAVGEKGSKVVGESTLGSTSTIAIAESDKAVVASASGKDASVPAVGEDASAAGVVEPKRNMLKPLLAILRNPRALILLFTCAYNGIVIGMAFDTGLTLYVNLRFGLNAQGAGLLFIAVVVPSFLASPLSGWLSDKYSARWPMFVGVFLSIPAFALLAIPNASLVAFICFLVILGFSLSFLVTPVAADLSKVADQIPDSTSYVFAMFNMSYSIGTLIGPIIGGQILEAVGIAKAWWIICLICALLALVELPAIYVWVGGRIERKQKTSEKTSSEAEEGTIAPVEKAE